MKTISRLLLPFLAGSIAFLSACSDPTLPSSSIGEETLSSISSEVKYEMDTEYTFSTWEELAPVFALSIPENVGDIPSYPGKEYVVKAVELGGGEAVYPVVYLSIRGVSSSASESYEKKLIQNGFMISADYEMAYKKASPTDDLIVEYFLQEKEVGYDLRLSFARVKSRLESYPAEFVTLLTDVNIPPLEGEAYNASYDPSGYGSVVAYGVDESGFVKYGKALEEAGFTLVENDSVYSRYVAKDGYLQLLLMLTYDEYNGTALYMRIDNAWPYVYLLALLEEDLPKLEVEPSRFSYAFVGEEEILTLYYDASTSEDYVEYCLLLESAGYVLESEETVNPSDPIQARRYVKGDASVDVLYKESVQSIAIPVYGKGAKS